LLQRLALWEEIGVFAAALIVGTAATGLSAPMLVVSFSKPLAILAGLITVFLSAGASTFVTLLWLGRYDLGHYVPRLTSQLVYQRSLLFTAHQLYEQNRAENARLCRARDAKAAYMQAVRRYKELELQSRKNVLLRTDWRSLRGEDFENYLADVFRELGYQIQLTKATGDQGVDLILEKAGSLIAVQAKGYEGGVGNHAVMEVYAGMNYYRCNGCMVITNSYFTPAAHALASSNNCRLLEGKDILDLIMGHLM
jgi:hypothetical protein